MAVPSAEKNAFFPAPRIRNEATRLGELRPRRVQEWLQGMRLDDPQLLQKAGQALYTNNRIPVDRPARREIVEIFTRFLVPRIHRAQEQYNDASLPLSLRNEQLCTLVTRCLQELANGHKIIANDILSDGSPDEQTAALGPLLVRLQHLLCTQVMNAYGVYRGLPTGVWRDLHLVHRLARDWLLADTPLDDELMDLAEGDTSLADRYVQFLLLTAAEPRALLRGETRRILALLNGLPVRARLERRPSSQRSSARFVVGLRSDTGPVPLGKVRRFQESDDFLVLDAMPVVQEIQSRLQAAGHPGSADAASVEESGFRDIDLQQRLSQRWSGEFHRQSSRSAVNTGIRICNGINAIHFFSLQPERLDDTIRSAPPVKATASEEADGESGRGRQRLLSRSRCRARPER